MASARYFVTERDESAKIGEMVKQRKSLKERISILENELRGFTLDWSVLSRINEGPSFSADRYVFSEREIKVMSPSFRGRHEANAPTFVESKVIPLKSLDKEEVIRLLTDLSETRNELERVREELRPFSID